MDRGRQQISRARGQAQAVLLAPHENLHVVPRAHRFMDFACVPSVPFQFTRRLSILLHCIVHDGRHAAAPLVPPPAPASLTSPAQPRDVLQKRGGTDMYHMHTTKACLFALCLSRMLNAFDCWWDHGAHIVALIFLAIHVEVGRQLVVEQHRWSVAGAIGPADRPLRATSATSEPNPGIAGGTPTPSGASASTIRLSDGVSGGTEPSPNPTRSLLPRFAAMWVSHKDTPRTQHRLVRRRGATPWQEKAAQEHTPSVCVGCAVRFRWRGMKATLHNEPVNAEVATHAGTRTVMFVCRVGPPSTA